MFPHTFAPAGTNSRALGVSTFMKRTTRIVSGALGLLLVLSVLLGALGGGSASRREHVGVDRLTPMSQQAPSHCERVFIASLLPYPHVVGKH